MFLIIDWKLHNNVSTVMWAWGYRYGYNSFWLVCPRQDIKRDHEKMKTHELLKKPIIY